MKQWRHIMDAVSNLDLFEEMYSLIKHPDTDIKKVIQEYGGSSLYIPSYKTTCRNDDIFEEYKNRMGEKHLVNKLAKKYQLSMSQIFKLTKTTREPTLF